MIGEWISVDDKLPKIRERVIIYSTFCNGYICISHIKKNGNWDDFKKEAVTHWMELPEAPE